MESWIGPGSGGSGNVSILSYRFILFVFAAAAWFYLTPRRARWLVLLAVSLIFYGFAGWRSLAYLLGVSGVTYGGARWLGALKEKAGPAAKRPEKKRARAVLALTLALGLGGMIFVKYLEGVCGWVNRLLLNGGMAAAFPVPRLLAPLGLSYFTFQSAGYVIDVYRGKLPPERNPLKYLLFVSFFPQMTQGPISAYGQLAPQLLAPRRFEPEAFVSGVLLALWGYFKKLVLADRLARVTAEPGQPGWLILGALGLYMVRLYADFSGGMDVALGVSRMLGVDLARNFCRPFFSRSVAEYWRRWHITLGAWFRTYLFYPLTTSYAGLALGRWGKKRLGKKVGAALPAAGATVVIFLAIGLWHAANWNAVLYGLYFGLLLGGAQLLESFFRKAKKRLGISERHPLWQALSMARTWLLLLAAQCFVCAPAPGEAFALLGGMLRGWGSADVLLTLTGLMPAREWLIAGLALLTLVTVDILEERGRNIGDNLAHGPFPLRWLIMLLLIVTILVFGCYGAGFDQTAFLYTNF